MTKHQDFFMYKLSDQLYFPPVETAHPSGIVAFGGDLSAERLVLAYQSGIFPWFEDGEEITWFAPEHRMVLFLNELKISKSMRNVLNRNIFKVTFNTAFEEVIVQCQKTKRKDQLGFAKSVEVWHHNELVGGLYGIDLGHIFCGESMFSKISNASKAGFIHLVQKLRNENYQLLDAQVYNEHLESLGCREIPRTLFMKILKKETHVIYKD